MSRTLRIAIVGPSPCAACDAACCKQSAWPFAVLLQGEAEQRRFRPWSTTTQLMDADGQHPADRIRAFMLSSASGSTCLPATGPSRTDEVQVHTVLIGP